mmetsp:Transcript_41523/g.97391  ORF Transcript_41523/g.97391 Transcript_41523/m.97391 type:complete len:368 (-) Transcript_41523:24-1127(-)
MLSRFRIPYNRISSAIQDLDETTLTADDLAACLQFVPTQEECAILTAFNGDVNSLGQADRYFLALAAIPRLKERLSVFHFKLSYPQRVSELSAHLSNVMTACDEVMEGAQFRSLLQIVLALGNELNRGTFAGNAAGYKLAALMRLSEVRTIDGKSDLLHYLVVRLHDKAPDVLTFVTELAHAHPAAKLDLVDLEVEVGELQRGMELIREELEEVPDDMVLQLKLSDFVEAGSAEVASLEGRLERTQQSFQTTLTAYGETDKNTRLHEFFGMVHKVVGMFTKSVEAHHRDIQLADQKEERIRRRRASEAASLALKKEQERPQDPSAVDKVEGALNQILLTSRERRRSGRDRASSVSSLTESGVEAEGQ